MEEILTSVWESVFYGIFGGNFLYLMLALAALFRAFTYRKRSKAIEVASAEYQQTVDSQKETAASVAGAEERLGQHLCHFGENPDGSPRTIRTGRYELHGETDGIRWRMESFIRLNSANYDNKPTTHVYRLDEMDLSLKFTCESISLSPGEFLLIISSPSMKGATQIAPSEGSGIFGKIVASAIQTAASAAISFYTKGYFGDEGKKVKIKGSPAHVSQNPEFAEKFYAVASTLRLLERTLTGEFERFLLEWREKDFGFVKESAIDQHGILFTDKGLTLGAQSAIIDPEKAEILARYAAELCKQLKRAI
ncbi:MAG: hypothetical protein SFU91_14095 [Chloroherpetonaceae bacterium]|nr:hypothetical protein [Chloroherpetonaceae bacterium]